MRHKLFKKDCEYPVNDYALGTIPIKDNTIQKF